MSEPDDCVASLDKWVKMKKNTIYDANIRGPSNKQDVLENYTSVLETFALELIHNIQTENYKELDSMNWPDDLMECIKDMNIRTVIMERIDKWFIRYPFVKSKLHLDELYRENTSMTNR